MAQIDVQEKISSLLAGDERRIVFWYDDDGAYADEVKDMELPLGCKLWIVTPDNTFETKLQLEVRDPNTSYLLYAPFPRPEDQGNFLADVYYYSIPFTSDKLVQIMDDIGIPLSLREEVTKYRKIFTSANCEKLKRLSITDWNKESLELGMLCCLAGVKVLRFDELLRKVVLAGTEETKLLQKIKDAGLSDAFWGMCEKHMGYRDDTPTIKEFLCSMVVTYMHTIMEGSLPAPWKLFLTAKPNDAVVFVKNLMNNTESQAFYDAFALEASTELNAASQLRKLTLEDILECDALEDFDENLLSWMIAKLEDSMLDEKIAGMGISEVCLERMKPYYHYHAKYEAQYRIVYHAHQLMYDIAHFSFRPNVADAIKEYAETNYLIDRHYRKFYYWLDAVGMTPELEKIRQLVENIYTNKYLTDYAAKWNQILTDEAYRTYTGHRQERFYWDWVYPFQHHGARKFRVIVIISDGMRYECARELYEALELDEKCSVEIAPMLGVLPSETTLGMASLLPHKSIQVDTDLNILVDGMKCGNSTMDRQKILQSREPKSVCCDFDFLKTASQEEIRNLLQGQEIVYAYQNQIDQRGEGQRSENEVFNACAEAVKEIDFVIHRLTGFISQTRFLVTADHGFIYKRDKLIESDKISIDKTDIPKTNYRYLLSEKHSYDSDALVTRTLTHLSAENTVTVTTPKGADIIKKQAGGMNYVHGGSSLQEMVVPVLRIVTAKGKQETGTVAVEISSFFSKITSIDFRVDFMQMEPVTDRKKAHRLVAYFMDENGNKISYEVPIIADSRDSEPSKRLITEKFTLKSGKYERGKDYYLVLEEMDKKDKDDPIHQKYRFSIDITEY